MEITLRPELEQFVHAKIESGQYQSVDEAINAGLQMLITTDITYQGRCEELRKEILLGIEASERGEVVDGETAMRELLMKLQQRLVQENR